MLKRINLKSISFPFFLVILIFGYIIILGYNEPVYRAIIMDRSELEKSVAFLSPQDIKKPGKIYIKDNYLFINERYKGIHVINNADSTNPQNIGFIRIPGNVDIAMQNNILYADNAVDLIAIDMSDIYNPSETKRERNVFPELLPPGLDYIPSTYKKENRPDNTVIVEWEKVTPSDN